MVTDEVTCVGCDGDDALCNCTGVSWSHFNALAESAHATREPANLPCPENSDDTNAALDREQWCN